MRRRGGRLLVQGSSVFVDPLLVLADLSKRRLDRVLKASLVIFFESDETKRLLGPGNGLQHFSSAEHRTGRSHKHQLYTGLPHHRFGQRKNAAGKRDYFQLSLGSMAIFEPKNCRSDVRQIETWSATIGNTRIGLGEGVHRMSILFLSPHEEVTEGHGMVSLLWDVRWANSELGGELELLSPVFHGWEQDQDDAGSVVGVHSTLSTSLRKEEGGSQCGRGFVTNQHKP